MKNVIVGQSGGPTAVIIPASGVFKTAKDRGADVVYGMVHGIKGLLDRNIVDLSAHIKNDLDMDLLKRTPSSFLGSCRYKLPDIEGNEKTYEEIFKILKEYNIYAFFYIGGNDSMDTIKKLSDYGEKINSPIRFMGVPKTIDNDLAITDHTPGYGSAAKYIASTTKEIIRDGLVYDYPVVSIIEVMGRNAGWLTAAAALAKGEDCEGVDLIYLPERVFDLDKFLAKVGELYKQKRSVVIAVSEGVKIADGRYVCELADHVDYVDAFGHQTACGHRALPRREGGGKVRRKDEGDRAFVVAALRVAHNLAHRRDRGVQRGRRGRKGCVRGNERTGNHLEARIGRPVYVRDRTCRRSLYSQR